jgi:hypothetical protein
MGWQVNNELERIWKDLEGSGMGLILRHYSGIHLKGLRKPLENAVRTEILRAEIWTRDIPNTKQEC